MKLTITTILTLGLALLWPAGLCAAPITPTAWKQSNAINTSRTAANLATGTGMDAGQINLYNHDGLIDGVANPADPTSANNSQWATSSKGDNAAAATAGKIWIVADLGATYDLTTLKIWNFNWDSTPDTPATSLNTRGVSQFDVFVRNSVADTSDGTPIGTDINLSSISDSPNALTNSVPFEVGSANPWSLVIENQAFAQAPNSDTYAGESFDLTGQTGRFVAIRVDSVITSGSGIGLGKVRFEGTLAVENVPPALLASRIPADDATNVLISTDLVAIFSEAIQKGTGELAIKRTIDDSVVETFDVETSTRLTFPEAQPQQVVIDPTFDLVADTEYYVQIAGTAIKDLSGNFFPGIVDPDTTSWSFTTDNTAPTYGSYSPATPTLADPGTRLLVSFNEAVKAGNGTVTIFKASDNSLVETINVTTPGALAAIGNTVAVVRSVALAPNTAYYVNASAGAVTDVSGNPAAAITGTSAWTFTTTTAVPLVVENFNGSSAPLNGTSADTFAAAITTAGGSSTWAAWEGMLENGAVSASASGLAYLNLGTFINATKGTAAGKFELTMTLAETTGNWVSLGFATNPTLAIGQNFTTIGGQGTILYRAQNSPTVVGELDMFGGPGSNNPVDGPDSNTGFRTLTVALDLTGYNGTDNFGSVTWSDSVLGVLGTYPYASARDFGSLVVSLTGSSGTINALAFYQTGSVGNTFASWIGTFNVGGLNGVNDDFDNDNLGNALENLLGTSPEVFSRGLTTVSASGGNLVFRHTLSTTPASDLTGAYEWSTDLVNWNADAASAGGTTVTFADPVVITPGTPDLVEITANVSGTPVSKVFARYKATQN